MTDQEIAEGFRDLFAAAHASADAKSEGPGRTRGRRLVAVAHAAANALYHHALDEGLIEPFSGGDVKPDE